MRFHRSAVLFLASTTVTWYAYICDANSASQGGLTPNSYGSFGVGGASNSYGSSNYNDNKPYGQQQPQQQQQQIFDPYLSSSQQSRQPSYDPQQQVQQQVHPQQMNRMRDESKRDEQQPQTDAIATVTATEERNSDGANSDSVKEFPPALSSLPPGWSEHIDPASGQSYYYNENDGTTTWDRPEPESKGVTTEADSTRTTEEQPQLQQQHQLQQLQQQADTNINTVDDKPPAAGRPEEVSTGSLGSDSTQTESLTLKEAGTETTTPNLAASESSAGSLDLHVAEVKTSTSPQYPETSSEKTEQLQDRLTLSSDPQSHPDLESSKSLKPQLSHHHQEATNEQLPPQQYPQQPQYIQQQQPPQPQQPIQHQFPSQQQKYNLPQQIYHHQQRPQPQYQHPQFQQHQQHQQHQQNLQYQQQQYQQQPRQHQSVWGSEGVNPERRRDGQSEPIPWEAKGVDPAALRSQNSYQQYQPPQTHYQPHLPHVQQPRRNQPQPSHSIPDSNLDLQSSLKPHSEAKISNRILESSDPATTSLASQQRDNSLPIQHIPSPNSNLLQPQTGTVSEQLNKPLTAVGQQESKISDGGASQTGTNIDVDPNSGLRPPTAFLPPSTRNDPAPNNHRPWGLLFKTPPNNADMAKTQQQQQQQQQQQIPGQPKIHSGQGLLSPPLQQQNQATVGHGRLDRPIQSSPYVVSATAQNQNLPLSQQQQLPPGTSILSDGTQSQGKVDSKSGVDAQRISTHTLDPQQAEQPLSGTSPPQHGQYQKHQPQKTEQSQQRGPFSSVQQQGQPNVIQTQPGQRQYPPQQQQKPGTPYPPYRNPYGKPNPYNLGHQNTVHGRPPPAGYRPPVHGQQQQLLPPPQYQKQPTPQYHQQPPPQYQQQQQQPPPQQMFLPSPPAVTERSLVPVGQEQPNVVQETIGRTWQSILTFGGRTKEAVGQAKESVVTSAKGAQQSITTTGTSWWEVARNRFGSVFETVPDEDYSLANIYGSAASPPAASLQHPQTNAGSVASQTHLHQHPSQAQQQQAPPLQQNYPPPQQRGYPPQQQQQQPGGMGYTNQRQPGSAQQQGRPQYPIQQQHGNLIQPNSQLHQLNPKLQQQQQQQGSPQGRVLPPGYNPPQPRSDVALPPNLPGQNMYPQQVLPNSSSLPSRPIPQQQQLPPIQSQWRGGPTQGHPMGQQQQYQQLQQQQSYDPRMVGYPSQTGRPNIPTENTKEQPKVDEKSQSVDPGTWFDHPALSGF